MDEVRTATCWDYVGASIGEAEGDRSTDARRSADDGGGASSQIETRECHVREIW